jgi:polyisoprenoid-binding protein YceI
MVGGIEFVPETLRSIAAIDDRSRLAGDYGRSAMERREIERVMFDEVLQRSVYPRIAYKSSRVSASKTGENVFQVNLNGDLTLHGITRGVGLQAQVVAVEDRLQAQGSFILMQSDYGLRIASVAGSTLKLKDELRGAYFILGRRQDQELRN